MTTLAGRTVQTVFAALSFAGAGWLFQHLNKSGYEKETKRHNKALEELAKAKESFYENEVKNRDRIQQLRQRIKDAKDDIMDTNAALDELRRVQTVHYNGRRFSRPPRINDFYKPSKEMNEYQTVVSGAVGVGTGLLAYYIASMVI